MGMNEVQKKTKIWPFVIIGVIVLAGFIVWDYTKHREVEEYVAVTPDIPGAGVPKDSTAELVAFRQVKDALTRRTTAGDVKIIVIWNSPGFFRGLATAQGERDIKRHEILYHEYAKRFHVHSDLVFTLILDSGSVDLQAFPVRQNVLLRNDKGF